MQVKKDDIQNKILTVAERLFIKNGYENTSLKMIADRSYISKSNIYRYYKSKDEIYETLVGPARQALIQSMSFFMTEDFIGKYTADKCEEIAGVLAKLASENRSGILIMLRSSEGADRKMIEEHIIKMFVEACPIDDDDIKELISKLLIFGMTDIILNNEDEESLRREFRHLEYYHYLGLNGLKNYLGAG